MREASDRSLLALSKGKKSMNGLALTCLAFGLLAGFTLSHLLTSIKVHNAINAVEKGFEDAIKDMSSVVSISETAVMLKLKADSAAVKNAFYMLRAKL